MQDLIKAVEKHKDLILKTERFIWEHPETGFREKETSKYLEEVYIDLGYDIVRAEGITGFYTVIDTGRPGPEILILGEMDSVICPTHKDANPQTGAVHACGHNAQSAALVGIAAALKEQKILDKFCGKIRLCAVPAEESIELDFRTELMKSGKIKYINGKNEFLSRGYFDGVDMAFMVHTGTEYMIKQGFNGNIIKKVYYKGTASHAANAWLGKNALYAATCGINAVNAIRETFAEPDAIRVHPIITHGGEIVNAIPELVQLESFVRGNNYDAIHTANRRINQALCGAAASIGTNIEIVDIPGSSPLKNDRNMIQVAKEALELAAPEQHFDIKEVMSAGCTDMGNLSCVMPVIHPYGMGAKGKFHGNSLVIDDPETACVTSAKWQLAMLLILLQNNAERAKKVISEFTPVFDSKEKYFEFIDSLNSSGDRIIYHENGTVEMNIN